jgi:pantoate--beta-alanine ligase
MARDLELAAWTEVVGVPTVRESDGLALSSRNAYLSPEERIRALSLSAGLQAAADAFSAGERGAAALLAAARGQLEGRVDRVDYVELVDADTLKPVERIDGPACLLVAAYVGRTRLIDNRIF